MVSTLSPFTSPSSISHTPIPIPAYRQLSSALAAIRDGGPQDPNSGEPATRTHFGSKVEVVELMVAIAAVVEGDDAIGLDARQRCSRQRVGSA